MESTGIRRAFWFLGPALGIVLSVGLAVAAPAAPRLPQSDNTKTNAGDANKGATTADQQKGNPADRETTRKIRAEIMKDKSLSTYAHNVKVITQDGKVTLKGPVRTADEKTAIEQKATAIAGEGNVTDAIEIAPAK